MSSGSNSTKHHVQSPKHEKNSRCPHALYPVEDKQDHCKSLPTGKFLSGSFYYIYLILSIFVQFLSAIPFERFLKYKYPLLYFLKRKKVWSYTLSMCEDVGGCTHVGEELGQRRDVVDGCSAFPGGVPEHGETQLGDRDARQEA